jgi:hypothetical protein
LLSAGRDTWREVLVMPLNKYMREKEKAIKKEQERKKRKKKDFLLGFFFKKRCRTATLYGPRQSVIAN